MNNSSAVLSTINKFQKLPKAQKELFSATIEDIQKMDERIASIENKVETVITEQMEQRKSIDRLSDLIKASIEQKNSLTSLLRILFSNKWFWLWFIVFVVVVGGGSVAELANVIHIGG